MAKKVDFYVLPTAIATFSLVALVVLIAFLIFGCAGPISRGFEEHQQAGICRLTVENQTAYAAEIRSERFYEYGRDGLLPHTSGTLIIKQNRRYVLILRKDVNGLAWDERYEFFIPMGAESHIITLGGEQVGVLINQCTCEITICPPNSTQHLVLAPGEAATVSSLPGKPIFLIYFGKDRASWVEVEFTVDNIRGNQFFDGKPVDWSGSIVPRMRDQSRQTHL